MIQSASVNNYFVVAQAAARNAVSLKHMQQQNHSLFFWNFAMNRIAHYYANKSCVNIRESSDNNNNY